MAGGVFWTGQRMELRVKPQNRNRKEVNAMRVGVIGLGDMGSGLAKNLIANGHEVTGLDLSTDRMEALAGMGGTPAASVAEVGEYADAVFPSPLETIGQPERSASLAAGTGLDPPLS